MRARSLYEFDQIAATSLYGHSSIEEYILTESSGFVCHNIDVPILTINADDDPLFPPGMVERTMQFVNASEHMTFVRIGKHGAPRCRTE